MGRVVVMDPPDFDGRGMGRLFVGALPEGVGEVRTAGQEESGAHEFNAGQHFR